MKRKKIINLFYVISGVTLFLTSCGDSTTQNATNSDSIIVESTESNKNSSDTGLKEFLFDIADNYGWQTTSDDKMLDFFKDGRLAIQGPDGEATMWEGKWSIDGNQITLECSDIKLNETVTAKIDGENLVLGTKIYTRYFAK